MHRRWIVALAAVVLASPASGQFTTFIAPPSPVKDSIKAAVAAEQHATADSITHARITDMKTWVDSAAGLTPARVADSVRIADSVRVADTVAAVTSMISNGVVAPQTASLLPFLLAIGGSVMVLGVGLLRVPRAEQRRIDD